MFDLGFIKDIRYLLRRLPKPDGAALLLVARSANARTRSPDCR